MAYEMREGQGSLFKNGKREKETHPNARGEAMIGGVVYEIAAWTKKDKNGNPWQSLAFKVKGLERDGSVRPEAQKAKPWKPDFGDDIPF